MKKPDAETQRLHELERMMKKPDAETQRLHELERIWRGIVPHYDKQELSRGKATRTRPKPRLDEIEQRQK